MKPDQRSGYPAGQVALLRATCIELARVLPAPVANQVTLVGGVVPSLRVPPVVHDPHPGSLDVDIGVDIGVGDTAALAEVERHLEKAGFGPASETRERWKYPADASKHTITIDLILAGTWLPEIRFAFQDRDRLAIDGHDFSGRPASVQLWVCGFAAFVLLKGLAFHRRKLTKDAFDIYWCLKYWPRLWNDLESKMAPFMSDPAAREILGYLADDFVEGRLGPDSAARFASGAADDEVEADAQGYVERMLNTIHFL